MTPTPPTSPADAGASGSACARVLPLVPGLGRPPANGRPLPDATAVRLLMVPDAAPPYDDERDEADRATPRAPRRLAVAMALRAMAPGRPPGSAAPSGQARGGDGHDALSSQAAVPGRPLPPDQNSLSAQAAVPGRGRRQQAPGTGWPGQFAQVLAETLAGSRPQGQIVPWTTDQARRRIRQLGPMLTAGVQPRVRRVVTFRPTEDVVEMTVIVGFGPRIRALAVRLERDGSRRASPGRAARAARWVCTVIEAA
jgi:hypothetical protein